MQKSLLFLFPDSAADKKTIIAAVLRNIGEHQGTLWLMWDISLHPHRSEASSRSYEGLSTSYLSLNLWRLLLRLLELVPQGENLADATVPAGRCHGLPVKGNILLDGGVHQAAVFGLGHGHVALCHDLIWAALHLLPLRGLVAVLLLQRQVDAGAGRKQRRWWLPCLSEGFRKRPGLRTPLHVIISRLLCILHRLVSRLICPDFHYGLTKVWQQFLSAFICTLTGCLTRLKNNKTRLFSLSTNPFFSAAFSP